MDPLMEEARRRMLERRARLLRSALIEQELSREALSSVERGDSPGADEAVAVELGDHDRRELREIDAAIARMDGGTYGRCERCGHAVGRQRLRAVPEARLCVGCAEAR